MFDTTRLLALPEPLESGDEADAQRLRGEERRGA